MRRAILLRWCETAGRRANRLVVSLFTPGQTGLIARRNESLRQSPSSAGTRPAWWRGVTNLLFDTRANIEALENKSTRGQFSMTIQASWKEATSFDEKALGQGYVRLAVNWDGD